MIFLLFDTDKKICDAWHERLHMNSHVEIAQLDLDRALDSCRGDILVTPGNSFGIMDGGFDYAVRECFGEAIQMRVQRKIIAEYCGEQPVGASFLVQTGRPYPAFLAYTPTMRRPKEIDAEVVYNATRAAIIACHNGWQSDNMGDDGPMVLIPGMGTGYGKVSPKVAAEMMGAAIDGYLDAPKEIDELDWERGYSIDQHISDKKESE